MAGLLSPKPVSYLQQGNGQFASYARGLSNFSETPPLQSGSSAQGHHPLPGYAPNGTGHGINLQEDSKIYGLVIDLLDASSRESALLELSKKREQYDDLALVLWHSFGMSSSNPLLEDPDLVSEGIMPALLQEIVSVYPLLSPPNLTAHVSNRVCNALALLQCVASHSDTRQLFLNGAPSCYCYRIRLTRRIQPIYPSSCIHFSIQLPKPVRLNTCV